jgi:hypothetical protein
MNFSEVESEYPYVERQNSEGLRPQLSVEEKCSVAKAQFYSWEAAEIAYFSARN